MKRIQFDISDTDATKLKELVTASGATSMSEVLRNALNLYQFCVEKSRKGCTVQLIDPERNVIIEPVFPGFGT